MQFQRLTVRHLGPFEDLTLDLSALEGKLIAITGDNGAGKSTLLELLPGALYRNCPTRGSLVELATARDAHVEVAVSQGDGETYTIRQRVDSVSKRSEATIVLGSRSLLESTRVRDADAWVAAHLPSQQVLYASSFLAQGSAGFLELAASDRKSVLLRLLQIERYEAMAERAREYAREARAQLQIAEARLADTAGEYPRGSVAAAALKSCDATISETNAKLAEAKKQLQRALKEQARREHAEQLRAQRKDLTERLERGGLALIELRDSARECEQLQAQREAIAQAAKRHVDLTAELQRCDHTLNDERAALAQAKADLTVATQRVAAARDTWQDAKRRVQEARRMLKDADKLRALAATLPERRDALAEARAAAASVQDSLNNLHRLAEEAQTQRITGLRGGLKTIAENKAAVMKAATRVAVETLQADTALAKRARSAPEAITMLVERQTLLQAAIEEATEKLQAARSAQAAVAELGQVQAQAERLEVEVEQTAHKGKASAHAEQCAKAAAAQAEAAVTSRLRARRDLANAIDQCKPLADRMSALQAANARVAEIDAQLKRVRAERAIDEKALAALPAPPAADAVSLDAVQRTVDELEQALQAAQATRAERAHAVELAARGATLIKSQERAVSDAQALLADWQRLGRDLGKDGLQALEIDAAIPELTTLTNDLLHACHGARFTVQLHTQALSADGKRTLEALDVRVVDTEQGRDALAETYSGGERVVIGEALSLALTMLACRRAGLRAPTLVRDESGAALDPMNGRAYIAMLRRAGEILQAHKVLFVTHSPELQELADARIVIDGGTAQVLS
jgi:exonuclease SbcC